MSQIKYDVYEMLIKDKNEIIKKIKPGARIFLAFREDYGEQAENAFQTVFKHYINDCLKYLTASALSLTNDEVSEIIDDNNDDCIAIYHKKESYL